MGRLPAKSDLIPARNIICAAGFGILLAIALGASAVQAKPVRPSPSGIPIPSGPLEGYLDPVDVYPSGSLTLREALRAVKSGGTIYLHADESGNGVYKIFGPIRIEKPVRIVAADRDAGYVELVFKPSGGETPSSKCIEITFPEEKLALSASAEGSAPPPTAAGPSEPTNTAASQPAATPPDSETLSEPGKDAVVLQGLRISRDLGKGEPCVSVWRRELYVDHTVVYAGSGPAFDIRNSPNVRMGTLSPGGIDRSVLIQTDGREGLRNEASRSEGSRGEYGIRSDRKSNLVLEWTEIAGFKTGVKAEGNVKLRRGVQIHHSLKAGLFITGGAEHSDIFGPRNIVIGVDEKKLVGSGREHDEPVRKQPEFSNNSVGIEIEADFEGSTNIKSVTINCVNWPDIPNACGLGSEPETGIKIRGSKFDPKISIAASMITQQGVAIDTATPLEIGPGTTITGNAIGIRFNDPASGRRKPLTPYAVSGVNFLGHSQPDGAPPDRIIDLKFNGERKTETDLRLCGVNWPKISRPYIQDLKKRVKIGGLRIRAEGGAGFNQCYVDNLQGLKKSLLDNESLIAFNQVCPKPRPC
jgi:hypothetical protein